MELQLSIPGVNNFLTHKAVPGVRMQLLTRFFGCYWRNKYSHLVGFPEVFPSGLDYETWILGKGNEDIANAKAAVAATSAAAAATGNPRLIAAAASAASTAACVAALRVR